MRTLLQMLRHPIRTYYEWRFVRALEKALKNGKREPVNIEFQSYETWGGADWKDYSDVVEDNNPNTFLEDRVLEAAKVRFTKAKVSKKK